MLPYQFYNSNNVYIIVGAMIVFLTFPFFNAGKYKSAGKLETDNSFSLVPKIFVITYISGIFGAITSTLFNKILQACKKSRNVEVDPMALVNGCISGMIAVGAICQNTEPYYGILIGGVAGVYYNMHVRIMTKFFALDQVFNLVSAHISGGLWGLVSNGLFNQDFGIVSDFDNKGQFFGYEVFGLFYLYVWVPVCAFTYFILAQ